MYIKINIEKYRALTKSEKLEYIETLLKTDAEGLIPFKEFWDAYDKKIGRPKCEKKWKKLSLRDKEAILEHIPKYKAAQPNKMYRKNPETYLNGRAWEDEIISNEQPKEKDAAQIIFEQYGL